MSIDLRNEKIRYIAIGDSISEGYNGRYAFGFAGSMNKDSLITGISWPSYLARMIQKINKNILESYDNFAISGTRPEDWNYFLGIDDKKYNYKNSKHKIEFGRFLDSKENNPEKGRIKKLFKNFGETNKNDFEFLHNKIKQANLITINIGANYLIPKIPLDEISKWIVDKNYDNKKIETQLIEIIKTCEEDINIMIKQLKLLNNNASIYLIGYPSFFTPWYKLINNLFKNFEFDKDITTFLYKQINNTLKEISKKNEIYFIDVSNENFWNENQSKLTNLFFEIHPTIFGYKKMAQDILVKMSLSNDFFIQQKNEIVKQIPTFDLKYLNKDYGSYKNGIDFKSINVSDQKLIEKIYGLKNSSLWSKTNVELIDNKLKREINFEQSLNPDHNVDFELTISFKNALFSIINALNIKLSNKNTQKINEIIHKKQFTLFLIQSKLISTLLNNIQNELDTHYSKNKKISDEEFIAICLNQIFDLNFIFDFLKKLSIFFQKNPKSSIKDVKEIFYDLINQQNANIDKTKEILIKLIIVSINSLLAKHKIKMSDEYFIEIFNKLFNKKTFKEFLIKIFDFYFKNIFKFNHKIKTSSDLVKLFLKSDVLIQYDKFIFEILKHKECLQIFIKIICKKFKIKTNNKSVSIIQNFLISFIEYISSYYLLNNFVQEFLCEFILNKNKKISLQNLIEFFVFADKVKVIKNKNIKPIKQSTIENIVNGIDYIFKNSNYDKLIFQSIIKLQPLKFMFGTKTKKMNWITAIKVSQRMSTLEKPLSEFIKSAYKEHEKSKNKFNKYYQTTFRLILILLLTSFKIFKYGNNNHFWSTREVPTTSKFVMKLCGLNKSNNKIKSFLLEMIGEQNNQNLIRNCNEKNYKENQVLWYVFSYETNKIDRFTSKDKEEIIFESLKNGYWTNDK